MILSLVPLLALGQTQLDTVDDEIRTAHDILSYHIEVSIPNRGTAIAAATTITYEVNQRGAPLVLDFDSVFTIDSVVGPGVLERNPSISGSRMSIAVSGDVPDTLSVTVYYHGSPNDGLFIQENVHGRRSAFADNWPDRAHHWFPSEDHPNDKAFASFAIEVPPGWRAIANGTFEGSEPVAGERTVWRWRTRQRISPYNVVIGAGVMAVVEIGEVDGAPQSVWAFPQDSAYAVDGPFRRASDITRRLTDLIGPFPFAKLAHVQSSTRFGGMENASAIFYSEGAYASRRLSEATVAHEIAHQWFGDAVTELDWHHLWLSEGFASYFGPLYYELVGEDSTFTRLMLGARDRYLNSDDANRPVIDPEETSLFALLNRNNYQKGAWILRMLRAEVGDDAFFAGIREYYRVYRDSTALSDDLMRVLERHAARSLETFFRQWLLQPGYPQLTAGYRVVDGSLEVQLTQTQPESWGLFEMDVPVRVTAEGETRTFAVHVRDRVSSGRLEGISAVDSIAVDPAHLFLLVVSYE